MKTKKPFQFPANRQARLLCFTLGILVTVAVTWLFAHEGHAPLPTKGAQVDFVKGIVTLTPGSRNVLDIRTEEVKPSVVAEKVLAYATLVSPWLRHAFVST